ncbi:hypothetical protein FHR81_000175 [Actinoalloteichus hoggarensis]|uniref:Uncharacterized protein n=1 Tax=Actinoalloteichus hoggarensis TaxID=1470176 RepID=A0A221W3C9_9PSEU|nr:hypothetical protein AHOG_12490 [Actinoalloteichus hoggarensis]MBB5919146.1 hypothetical protein [Actinoalloteichus hoggarensis]
MRCAWPAETSRRRGPALRRGLRPVDRLGRADLGPGGEEDVLVGRRRRILPNGARGRGVSCGMGTIRSPRSARDSAARGSAPRVTVPGEGRGPPTTGPARSTVDAAGPDDREVVAGPEVDGEGSRTIGAAAAGDAPDAQRRSASARRNVDGGVRPARVRRRRPPAHSGATAEPAGPGADVRPGVAPSPGVHLSGRLPAASRRPARSTLVSWSSRLPRSPRGTGDDAALPPPPRMNDPDHVMTRTRREPSRR